MCFRPRIDQVRPRRLYRRALAIWERSLGPDHPNVASALNNLAGVLRAKNRLGEAEPLLRRVLEILLEVHPDRAVTNIPTSATPSPIMWVHFSPWARAPSKSAPARRRSAGRSACRSAAISLRNDGFRVSSSGSPCPEAPSSADLLVHLLRLDHILRTRLDRPLERDQEPSALPFGFLCR